MAHTKVVDKALLLSTIQDLFKEGKRTVRLNGCRIDGEPSIALGIDPQGRYEVTFLTSMSLGTTGGVHHVSRESLEEVQHALAEWLSAASQENTLSRRAAHRFGSGSVPTMEPLAGRIRRLLFS